MNRIGVKSVFVSFLIGLFCIVMPSFAAGAPAMVGGTFKKQQNGVSTLTTSSHTTTTGNTIVCAVFGFANTNLNLTLTDLAGDVFKPVGETPSTMGALHYASNITGFTNNTVTVTWAGSQTQAAITCGEFSGLSTNANIVEKYVAGSNPASIRTAIANELLVAAGPACSAGAVPSNGWGTIGNDRPMCADVAAFTTFPSPQSTTSTWTGGTPPTEQVIAAFLPPFTGCSNANLAYGTAGMTIWDSVGGRMMYCNGTTWKDTSQSTIGFCGGTPTGTMRYVGGTFQYCDGLRWVSMKGASLGACAAAVGTLVWDSSASKMKFCDGSNWYDITYSGTGTTLCRTYITGSGTIATAGSFTVPTSWNATNNSIEVIGGGGAGTAGTGAAGQGGGGGGAFAVIYNQNLTSLCGASCSYSVGGGGGTVGVAVAGKDSWVCNSGGGCVAANSANSIVGAAGGGVGATGGAGGSVKNPSGYNGGNGATNTTTSGGGGGGAAGPYGIGANGVTTTGGTADLSHGGAGKAGGNPGQNGGAGSEWSTTACTGSTPCGTGGGAGSGNGVSRLGGTGGLYGGGGGGGGKSSLGGPGSPGMIVFTWYGTAGCP